MTKILKTSALIACLLSSFAMTAVAGVEDKEHKFIHNLFEKIQQKKSSSNAKEKADGLKAESIICDNIPKHCQNGTLTNPNVGAELNEDSSPEAKAVCQGMINIPGVLKVNW